MLIHSTKIPLGLLLFDRNFFPFYSQILFFFLFSEALKEKIKILTVYSVASLVTRNLQHCRMDCRWKRGIFFFFYEAGKDKDEGEKKRGFCGQCYEACFSDGFEYSVFLPGLLSTVLDSVTRALFPENPLGSSFLSALCGSRSRCLHFSP